MSQINLKITGISVELALGNYMPKDATIFNDWEDFFHFNNLIHESQLLVEHISNIEIKQDGEVIFSGKIPMTHFQNQKSFAPAMEHRALYLRTECVEEAEYQCTFEVDDFDKSKLLFEIQDYDALFKVGKSFLSRVIYDHKDLKLEWESGKPIGNICLLCRFENGYLLPIYDAVNKIAVD